MAYVSDRGTFATLQLLRAAYLKSPDGEKYWLDPTPFGGDEWDPETLHLSELGACPRAIAYRLSGEPEKPRSLSSIANREVMFWAGYRFHYLTYSALNWAGLLVDHEIAAKLSHGWSGRADAIIRPVQHGEDLIGYDMKTVLPNALKYVWDMPKTKDCLQVGGYAFASLFDKAVIEYADRAGSNTPKECEVAAGAWAKRVPAIMAELEHVRDNVPELPPILPQVYNGHFKEQGNAGTLDTITLENDWRCNYCDYHLTKKERRLNPHTKRMKIHGWTQKESSCKPPNAPGVVVCQWNGGNPKTTPGHEDGVEAWLDSHPKHYEIPEEE
jgi:hypothetical protein